MAPGSVRASPMRTGAPGLRRSGGGRCRRDPVRDLGALSVTSAVSLGGPASGSPPAGWPYIAGCRTRTTGGYPARSWGADGLAQPVASLAEAAAAVDRVIDCRGRCRQGRTRTPRRSARVRCPNPSGHRSPAHRRAWQSPPTPYRTHGRARARGRRGRAEPRPPSACRTRWSSGSRPPAPRSSPRWRRCPTTACTKRRSTTRRDWWRPASRWCTAPTSATRGRGQASIRPSWRLLADAGLGPEGALRAATAGSAAVAGLPTRVTGMLRIAQRMNGVVLPAHPVDDPTCCRGRRPSRPVLASIFANRSPAYRAISAIVAPVTRTRSAGDRSGRARDVRPTRTPCPCCSALAFRTVGSRRRCPMGADTATT